MGFLRALGVVIGLVCEMGYSSGAGFEVVRGSRPWIGSDKWFGAGEGWPKKPTSESRAGTP
jgi:hypothetical protein